MHFRFFMVKSEGRFQGQGFRFQDLTRLPFLNPANDFHGQIDDLQTALTEIRSKDWRVTCSAHGNHQDFPAEDRPAVVKSPGEPSDPIVEESNTELKVRT